jgi:asparagine synthase (glutamine-hydrolysing)
MSTLDGRYHIVFNGEVYNYVELARELSVAGAAFTTHCDTEVLLAAYAHWGAAALTRLTGMFAFAILDTRARRLFLARDGFGIKPLYYAAWPGGLAFSSEIPPLLGLPQVGRQANPHRLYEYLRFGIGDYGGATLLANVRQVPPGHWAEISIDAPAEPAFAPYWQPNPDARRDMPFEQAAERLREIFLNNIRLHLRSDVPVGACLSGGIDSSAIVCGMRHVGGKDLDIHAFSYAAGLGAVNEEPWMDLVGAAAGAVVHKVRPSAGELVADLDRLIEAQGEPFASTSMYAQYRVFGLAAAAGVKVMLDGQGADELLGGYRYFIGARITSLIRAGRWGQAANLLRRALHLPGPGGGAWLAAYTGLFLLPPGLGKLACRLIGQDLEPAWLNARWFAQRGVQAANPRASRSLDALREQLIQTLTKTSLPKLLRYEDRNSMAWSIESRVPFLTPELADFALALPEEYHVAPDGLGKALFRRAMRGIVPDRVLDRRDKIGFETPERAWLTSLAPWVESVLAGDTARRIAPLNFAQLNRQWQAVLREPKRFDRQVWRWVNLIRWAERFEVTF